MPKIVGYQHFNTHEQTSLVFRKTGKQICEKATRLLVEIDTLIGDREKSIRELSSTMGVADAAELLLRHRRGEEDDGAVSASIRNELEDLRRKRIDQARLRAIVENIEPERTFDLSFAELEYYEF